MCWWLALLAFPVCAARPQNLAPPTWNLTRDAASFDKLEQERLERAEKAIDALLQVKGARTVDNTVGPFDEAVRELGNAANLAKMVEEAHPDGVYREHARALTRKAEAAIAALQVNRDVYQALASLNLSRADPATRFYVERRLLMARLAGVDKDDSTRARLTELKDELAQAESAFDRNMNESHEEVLAEASELEGLPTDFIEQHKPGSDGKARLNVDNPTAYTVEAYARSSTLRRRMYKAWDSRGYPQNREVLPQMLRLRFEVARLLGYSSWADYHVAPRMTKTAARVAQFIQEFDNVAWPAGQREYALLLEEKRKAEPEAASVTMDEAAYLTEQILSERFGYDSKALRAYLPYARVKEGMLNSAAKLFHVSFRQEKDFVGWDPSVESWLVYDGDGKTAMGRFYLDMHPRTGKFIGFENAVLLEPKSGKQLPEVVLLCNFARPSGNDPGLLTLADAQQVFHEFGHTMHRMSAYRQQWAGTNLRNMEFDFVETASQLFEQWPANPKVLASFARHYQTNEPVPDELLQRMKRASAFGRGYQTLVSNAYTAIAFDMHKGDPKEIDLDKLCQQDLRRYTHLEPVPDTHTYASFDQLEEPYTSDYYIYQWDQVIVRDFYQQFDQNDLFAGETPMRYRKMVLEPFGSMSASDLVKNFLGRPQTMNAFRKWLGEEFAESSDSAK